MEYMEGGSIADIMKQGGKTLDETSIAFVLRELLLVSVLPSLVSLDLLSSSEHRHWLTYTEI